MIDAFKRASAERITAVIPYYSYARQDWKDRPRVPISARLVADLLEAAGANRVLTMDLHSPQIQGFFSIPVDNLTSAPVLIKHIQNLKLQDPVIVSPDAGGVGRARFIAKRLDASLAIIDKRRPAPNEAQVPTATTAAALSASCWSGKVKLIRAGEANGPTAETAPESDVSSSAIPRYARYLRARPGPGLTGSCAHRVAGASFPSGGIPGPWRA